MSSFQGPTFQLVDQVSWEELSRTRNFGPQSRPLLVKGAVRPWPAWTKWSFERLSELRRPDGSEIVFRFQNGLVEQGVTREPLDLPISPYIRELSDRAREGNPGERGLVPLSKFKTLSKGEAFHLDWSYMKTFDSDRVYLAQWNILDEFPDMKKDFAIRTVWPGWRYTWEFVFIGPAHTVTGLHYDFPNNWFCQVRGTKEIVVFPPDQTAYLCKSRKYDWGATLSDVNISELDRMPERCAIFQQAKGYYARVEAGDALFIPKENWHAVVAQEPCISLGIFGLTPWEIVSGGGPSEFRSLLHKLHLYRWGNCTCHKMEAKGSEG
ncbi:MAG TPA: cupin-like domain-containing protein [Planctomycetota bacterium]|nr:cupin-like domain-containing protein [Planctomycetota bacterium]